MLIRKKLLIAFGVAQILIASSASANPEAKQVTRGIQVEGPALSKTTITPTVADFSTSSVGEKEVEGLINALRSGNVKNRTIAATELYKALGQCGDCSAEILFYGYSDVARSFVNDGRNADGITPQYRRGYSVNVLKEGIDRILRLQRADNTGSNYQSAGLAASLIRYLIDVIPDVYEEQKGPLYESYVETARKSRKSNLEGLALGEYLVWSVAHGDPEQSLKILDRLSALPNDNQLIPFSIVFKEGDISLLDIRSGPGWENIIKAIAYARAGKMDEAEAYFGSYLKVTASDNATGVSLRSEALYFLARGDNARYLDRIKRLSIFLEQGYQEFSEEEIEPLLQTSYRGLLKHYISQGEIYQARAIVSKAKKLFPYNRIFDPDTLLDFYWQDPNCRGARGVQSHACAVDEAFNIMNNSLNSVADGALAAKQQKFNFMEIQKSGDLAKSCEDGFRTGYSDNFFLSSITDMRPVRMDLEAMRALERRTVFGGPDCFVLAKSGSFSNEKMLRYLSGEQDYNVGFADREFTMPPLSLDEAYVQFYVNDNHVYVWVVSSGTIGWKRLDINRKLLSELVTKLREPLTFKKDQPFDRAAAWQIYKLLFSKIEELIAGKTKLYISANEPLSSLPFNLLIKSDPANADFRRTHWLIRDHAVTIFTSLSTLVHARAHPRAVRNRPNSMVAYYDPMFTTSNERKNPAYDPNEFGARSAGSNLDSISLLASLERLPGTANELELIKANFSSRDLELISGFRASETDIKKRNLSPYSIVYIATHGLTGPQLKPFSIGKVEPGLALSNPGNPSLLDDGVLQESEIYRLQLAADLVVLSGCNTAANGATSEDPISGLAAAFLYAGAGSVIATHWEISDAETARLMGNIFGSSIDVLGAGTSLALQQSTLSYLASLSDDSLAHPRYWAPFLVINASFDVGDNQRTAIWKNTIKNYPCAREEPRSRCNKVSSSTVIKCTTPSNPIEDMICRQPQLSALDGKMKRWYRVALGAELDSIDQLRWETAYRDQCRTEKCLVAQHVGRIEQFKAYIADFKPGKGYILEMRYPGGDWEEIALAAYSENDASDLEYCKDSAQRGLQRHNYTEFRCVTRRASVSGSKQVTWQAAPISKAAHVAPDGVTYERIDASTDTGNRLGIKGVVTSIKGALGIRSAILVQAVVNGSPAMDAGVQKGDIITAVYFDVVRDIDQLSQITSRIPLGTRFPLQITRAGRGQVLQVLSRDMQGINLP
jgi:CHAT domain-containing protein/uncharacterized protein